MSILMCDVPHSQIKFLLRYCFTANVCTVAQSFWRNSRNICRWCHRLHFIWHRGASAMEQCAEENRQRQERSGDREDSSQKQQRVTTVKEKGFCL